MRASLGWSLVPFVSVAAAGCGGDITSAVEREPPPVPVAVSGVVVDSLTGRAVPAALVSTAGGSAITDESGRFELTARLGAGSFRVTHQQYEFKTFQLNLDAGTGYRLEVAPLGPTVLGCAVRDGRMWMLVVDLQGRKTIVRRDSSGVTLGEAGAERWLPAHEFTWWALDELHWLVDGPPASSAEVGTARWHLFDTDGNVRPHRCGPAEVPDREEPDGGGDDPPVALRTAEENPPLPRGIPPEHPRRRSARG